MEDFQLLSEGVQSHAVMRLDLGKVFDYVLSRERLVSPTCIDPVQKAARGFRIPVNFSLTPFVQAIKEKLSMSLYRNRILAGATIALALVLPAAAQQAVNTPWVHVSVVEEGDKATTVKVNLPLSVVEVALAVAPDKIAKNGRLKLSSKDVSIADLRKLWNEVKTTGDAQFVSVEEKNQTVTVARKGRLVQIRVNDASKAEKPQTVHVDVPVNVVDALLAGEGEQLDIKNAIAQLQTERGDIVRVRDGRSNIRVWIDELSAQK